MPYRSLDWVVPIAQQEEARLFEQFQVGDKLTDRQSGQSVTLLEKKIDRWGWHKVRVRYACLERDQLEVMPWGRVWRSIGDFEQSATVAESN